MVSSIRTAGTVHLIVLFTVDTFEDMKTRLTFLCSELWRFWIYVFFAVPHFLPVVLSVVRSIAFRASRCIQLACKHWVALFLTALILWNSWVHIGTMNGSIILSYIETWVDDKFGNGTVLWVPNVDPDYSWIRVRQCFDYVGFWSKSNIFEDVHLLDSLCNYFKGNWLVSTLC